MESARVRTYHARSGRLSARKRAALADLQPDRRPALSVSASPATAGELCRRPGAPTVVEVGAGTGEAVLAVAALRPDWNFLAVEVHRASLATLLLRLDKAALANVTVWGGDAVELLGEGIAPASVTELWAYFPDPWPKLRQRSRRLIQPTFVACAAELMLDGGTLRLATDDAAYADQMRGVVATESALSMSQACGDGFSLRGQRPITYYESRARQAGRAVWDLHADRLPRAHCI